MYFLLTISLLLHLITIIAIIVLFQRRSIERANLPTLKEDVETLYESMEAFIDEIEKENEHYYQKLLTHIEKKEQEWKKQHHLSPEEEPQQKADLAIDEELITEGEKVTSKEIAEEVQQKRSIESVQQVNPGQSDTALLDVDQEQDLRSSMTAPHSQVGLSKEEKLEKVQELYRQGFSTDKIAKLLDIGKGEALLMIEMGKKKGERNIQSSK